MSILFSFTVRDFDGSVVVSDVVINSVFCNKVCVFANSDLTPRFIE